MGKSRALKRIVASLAAFSALGLISQASAGPIVSAVSATINTGGPGSGSINETFNQAGLLTTYSAGVTDYDTYIGANPQHSLVFAGNEWFANQFSNTLSVTYDLGSVKTIDAFALWNEDFSGIGLLDLLHSTDGVNFTPVLSNVAIVDSLNNADYGPQSFAFGAVSAQYFRVDGSRCPQAPVGYESCAIGEVAWRESAVPEPTSLALLGLALAGLGFARRKSS